jgi:hypothetical protein
MLEQRSNVGNIKRVRFEWIAQQVMPTYFEVVSPVAVDEPCIDIRGNDATAGPNTIGKPARDAAGAAAYLQTRPSWAQP